MGRRERKHQERTSERKRVIGGRDALALDPLFSGTTSEAGHGLANGD